MRKHDRVRRIWILSGSMSIGSVIGGAGCEPARQAAPVLQPPRPYLASAVDGQISMFGEVDDAQVSPFATQMNVALRQHTQTQEGADFDPDIDSTGRRLVFASTRHSPQADLYVKNVNGVAVTQLTADPSSDIHPAFSPDGTQVAFASDRTGNWDLWLIPVQGGQPVQLTDGPGHDVGPSWSPDGKSLVYCSLSEAGGQWELWVVDTTAGGPRRFIGHGLFPQWSPTGDTIVFQRSRQRGGRWFSIWTLELVDGEPRYPTEIASSSEQGLILPAWTTDGRRIAYSGVTALSYLAVDAPMVSPAGQADIWVVDADGGHRIRMTGGPGAGFSPVFSPDGRIYFTRRIMGLENIWSVGASAPGSAEARISRIDP